MKAAARERWALRVSIVLLLIFGFAGQGVAQWDTWSPPEAPPMSPSDVVTEPRLVVDDETVHMSYSEHILTSGTTQVWYNSREAGAWGARQQLSQVTTPPGEAHEPDIALWPGTNPGPTDIYVVWSQWDPADNEWTWAIYMSASFDGGHDWSLPVAPISNPLAASYEPSVAVDEDYTYVAWAQAFGPEGTRIAFAVFDRSGAKLCDEWATTEFGDFDDRRPRLVVDKTANGHEKNLVFQRRYQDDGGGVGDPTKDSTEEIYWIKSTAAECGGWPATPTRLSADDPLDQDADSLSPSLTHASGEYLHLVWEDHSETPPRIHYRRSLDLGETWDDEFVVPTNDPNLLAQSEPSVASCSTCIVGVAWTQVTVNPSDTEVYFQWSESNGDPGSWQTNPIPLTAVSGQSSAPALAADARRGVGDFQYLRLHLASDFYDAAFLIHGVRYSQSVGTPAESGELAVLSQVPPWVSGEGLSGAAVVIDASAQDTYVFGGVIDGFQHHRDTIYRIDTSNSVDDTLHRLALGSGKAWMPAVWWPGMPPYEARAYLFWGTLDGGSISDCITIYEPTGSPPVRCDSSTPPGIEPRFGASAVFDGTYIYIFGGSTASDGWGYPYNTGVTTDIPRIDTTVFNPDAPGASIENLCPPTCLPAPTMHSAAVWVGSGPGSPAAYIIRGSPSPHMSDIQNREIIRFTPPASVEIVARLPVTVGWGTPHPIPTSWAGEGYEPQVATDVAGNAVAVYEFWNLLPGAGRSIIASRYDVGSDRWGSQTLVEFSPGDARDPQVAAGADSAVAVWRQWDGATYSIYSNRYDISTDSWSPATDLLEVDSGEAELPQIGVSGNGNALAVWSQWDGADKSIYFNRDLGSGWMPAALPIESAAGTATNPQVAVNSNNAVAVWQQWDGTDWSIYANHYDFTSDSWDGPVVVEGSPDAALQPQVGINSVGDAMAVWTQWDGTYYSTFASRYSGGSWGPREVIDHSLGLHARDPQVAADSAGNAIAVWQQTYNGRETIMSNWYNAVTQAWQGAWRVNIYHTQNAYAPQVAIDGLGNGVVVWQEWDGERYGIWAARRETGAGYVWHSGVLIDDDGGTAGDSALPQVAVDGAGNAIAVWEQQSGTLRIWTNRYVFGVDPRTVPSWKFSATYDGSVDRIVIFGGSTTCGSGDLPGCELPWRWYYDTVFRFNPDPASYQVTLDPCQRLPSDREGTAAVWRASDQMSLVIGGSVGKGSKWEGIDEVVGYIG
jgi:hypothetical protein